MRIGFDAKRAFLNNTGLGNYSRDTIRVLSNYFPDNKYFLYTPKAKENSRLCFLNNNSNTFILTPKSLLNRALKSYWRSKSIVKDLFTNKIDIYQLIYESSSQSRILLLGNILRNIHYELDGEFAWFVVDKNMMSSAKASKADVEGFSDFVRTIRGVEVSMMIMQIDESSCRLNFRSTGKYIIYGAGEMIPVFEPTLTAEAHSYVSECMSTNWISSQGDFITKFETKLSKLHEDRHCAVTSSCTTALHLALLACDIGPGNCLIDEWIRKNSKKKYDHNGLIARSGNIDKLILNQALENFSFNPSYKKSLDVKDYDIFFAKGLSLENGAATITEFTAKLISDGIIYTNRDEQSKNYKLLVCGGGRKNDYLLERVQNNFVQLHLESIDKYQVDGDFVESQAFAYLAIRSFLKLPISFPETTGCKEACTGGALIRNY